MTDRQVPRRAWADYGPQAELKSPSVAVAAYSFPLKPSEFHNLLGIEARSLDERHEVSIEVDLSTE